MLCAESTMHGFLLSAIFLSDAQILKSTIRARAEIGRKQMPSSLDRMPIDLQIGLTNQRTWPPPVRSRCPCSRQGHPTRTGSWRGAPETKMER